MPQLRLRGPSSSWALLLLSVPVAAAAQDFDLRVPTLGPARIPDPYVDPRASVAYLDSVRAESPHRMELHLAAAREGTALGVLEPVKERRIASLQRAAEAARAALALDSLDAHAHYWLAAASGLEADEQGGRTKIGLAREAHTHTLRALELDSLHGGAHHILGRLHAGSKRLSFVSRLIARALGLGEILNEASWESAEHHMRVAAERDPDQWVHGYELGKLLISLGREAEGRSLLAELVAREPRHALHAHYAERARLELGAGGPLELQRPFRHYVH